MAVSKRDLNEYLFYDFGRDLTDSDAEQVSDSWPFKLVDLGLISAAGKSWSVFRFQDGDESFYAIANGYTSYLSEAGMDKDHLAMQLEGEAWIGDQDPVNLDTVEGSESETPPVPVRRSAIDELAATVVGESGFKLLVGLYLKRSRQYLALVSCTETGHCHAIGDRLRVRNIPFPEASAWRRLAIGVGKVVRAGRLS